MNIQTLLINVRNNVLNMHGTVFSDDFDYLTILNNKPKAKSHILITDGSKAGKVLPKDEVFALITRGSSNAHIYSYNNETFTSVADQFKVLATFHKSDIGYPHETADYPMFQKDKHLIYKSSSLAFSLDGLVWSSYYNNFITRHNSTELDYNWYGSDAYVHEQDARYADWDGSHIHEDDARRCDLTQVIMHNDDDACVYTNGVYVCIEHDDVCYCQDIDDYRLRDDCHYDEEDGEWYAELESRPNTIQEYHCGQQPTIHLDLNDYDSPLSSYTIGFEIEKCSLNGERYGRHDEQPLFSHWERDSSCGVEGITNVYGLNMHDDFVNAVDNSPYVNEQTSNECGGHVNLAHRSNMLEMWHLKPWMGLNWSMWRYRLKNSYSSRNKKVNPYEGRAHHYGCLVEKGTQTQKRFELRLPNRVDTGDQLKTRYLLMQALMTCVDSFIKEDYDVYTKAKWKDKNFGFPDWAISPLSNLPQEYSDLIALISPPTYKRMRYLIEQSKLPLLLSYNNKDKLQKVILLSYIFQEYIGLPFGESELSSQLMTHIREFV